MQRSFVFIHSANDLWTRHWGKWKTIKWTKIPWGLFSIGGYRKQARQTTQTGLYSVGGRKQGNKAAQRSRRCWLDERHWRRRGHGETDSAGWGGAADRCRSQGWTGSSRLGSSQGSPRLSGGFWQDLHDDLGFTKTILLLEVLKEPQRATPTTIYNDTISPRKHRLKVKKKKKNGAKSGVFCVFTHLILLTIPEQQGCYSHLTDEETEVQRCEGYAAL